MAARRRALSIAAASSRVGYVIYNGVGVEGWGLSRKASLGPSEAAACAAQWIEDLRPDVVITEKVRASSMKGEHTRAIIAEITAVATLADIPNVEIIRWQDYPSKYVEAEALARVFPNMAHLVPKARRPWDTEPKATVYFEALSLALSALGNPGQPSQPVA